MKAIKHYSIRLNKNYISLMLNKNKTKMSYPKLNEPTQIKIRQAKYYFG